MFSSFTGTAVLLFDFLVAFLALAGVLNKVRSSSNCSNLSSTTTAANVEADFWVALFSVDGVLNKVSIDSPST